MTARTTASPFWRAIDDARTTIATLGTSSLCTLSTKLERVAAQRRGEVARRGRALLSTSLSCVGAIAAAACPVDPCAVDDDARVELGHGASAFAAFSDGAPLPYTRGPQGGTHLDAALRIHGLLFASSAETPDDARDEQDLPVVDLQAWDDETPVAGFTDFSMLFSPIEPDDDDGNVDDVDDVGEVGEVGEVVGVPVIFVEDASTQVGATFVLRAHVRDRCSHEASAALSFVLVEPEATTPARDGG
jgi:hypothetical protein